MPGHLRSSVTAVTLEAVESMLLEREAELATLAAALEDGAEARGSVVLVAGEAGIGKSALIARLPQLVPAGGRLLVGWCDSLGTPRVLGPLRDVSADTGPTLAAALRSGDRGAVLDAALADLGSGGRPTVFVVEDVHWADDATLDVLSHVIRRLAALPLVVILTFRDDDLGVDHPLRQLLGLAARVATVRRVRPAPLSLKAVRALSAARGVDADRLFGVTSGNPYFVTELVATGDVDSVPLTIADAVAARLARLDQSLLAAVAQLAVNPSAAEPWFIDAVVPGGLSAVAAAEENGLLTIVDGRVIFRHELTRRAVLQAMPAARRVEANRRTLDALLARSPLDFPRVVHHAKEAGDRDAILVYGPLAAREAIRAGAHREGVAHLRLVLDQRPDLEPAAEADLWESLAVESYTVDAPFADAVAAQRRAVELRRGGDPRTLGASLRWLSRLTWWAGDSAVAAAAGEEARVVLADAGDPDLLAMAMSNQAQLFALAGRDEDAITLAEQGLALADIAAGTRSHLLNNLGLAMLRTRRPGGYAALEESLDVALAADEPEHACRAYVNLAWHDLERLDFAAAEAHATAGVDLAEGAEFLTFARYLQLIKAMVRFGTGRWDDVVALAAFAADGSPPIRCAALVVIGRLGARRGESSAVDQLREAWTIAQATGECQRIGPAAAALAEAAVLAGDPSSALEAVWTAYRLAHERGTPPVRAELAYWLQQLTDEPLEPPPASDIADEPCSLLRLGRWREAAQVWRAAGCRYEAAVALTHSRRPEELLAALAELDELGAEPLARTVRGELRALGVAHVPRGPLASTRDNPAGLTQRQWEVARLVTQGMTNAEIAGHLIVSVRTVDSHVAAVLAKLGVSSRRELVSRSDELGFGA